MKKSRRQPTSALHLLDFIPQRTRTSPPPAVTHVKPSHTPKQPAKTTSKRKKKSTLKKRILKDRCNQWYTKYPELKQTSSHPNVALLVRFASTSDPERQQQEVINQLQSSEGVVAMISSASSTLYILCRSIDSAKAMKQKCFELYRSKIVNACQVIGTDQLTTILWVYVGLSHPIQLHSRSILVKTILPKSTSDPTHNDDLQQHFSCFGKILSTQRIDQDTLIQYDRYQQATKAVDNYSHTDDNESTFKVNSWIPLEQLCAAGVCNNPVQMRRIIQVRGFVDAEEVEDEDEYLDIVQDVRAEMKKVACTVVQLIVAKEKTDVPVQLEAGDIAIEVKSIGEAHAVHQYFEGKTFGGQTLQVSSIDLTCTELLISNVLTKEEVQASDEYEDLKEEMLEYLGKYGTIVSLDIATEETKDPRIVPGIIHIKYSRVEMALAAFESLNGKVYAGRIVSVILFSCTFNTELLEWMGFPAFDKLTKVPKLPNPTPIREYVDQQMTAELDQLVTMLLKRLMFLQERARNKDPLKAKKTRRLVFGLREVYRSVKLKQSHCIIVAYNIDKCSIAQGLDDTVQDIIELARSKSIPVLFGLSRKRLGKALGKSIKVSCVSVLNMDGATSEYRAMLGKFECPTPEDAS